MTVEVYICKKFEHRHERTAFGRFLQEMIDRYSESEDLYVVIVEPEVNTASIDLIILTDHALIVAELKELTIAEGMNSSEIILNATEGGRWEYTPLGMSSYQMGSPEKPHNPYIQIKNHNFKLRDWIVKHHENISKSKLTQEEAIRKIYSWVVISPGFNKDQSKLDMPWQQIKDWFKILSLDELAYQVGLASNEDLSLTDEQKRLLAKQMGGEINTNLAEFIPNYVPPAAPISFFSRLPLPKGFIDRENEKAKLKEFLILSGAALVCIGGLGGIGKTFLSAWLCQEASVNGYKILWVDCGEREVSVESFLRALGSRMQDKYQQAIIFNPEGKLVDKYDIAIEFLERQKYLLIADDYHKITQASSKKIEAFFQRILQRSSCLKIVLTSRTRLEFLSKPEFPPGSIREIELDGLPIDCAREYLQAVSPRVYPKDQVEKIWERTDGNPYLIRLMLAVLRNRGEGPIESLPVFENDPGREWAESLLQTLTGDLRGLALKLSVAPINLDRCLIEHLAYKSTEKVHELIQGLLDQHILKEIDQNRYQVHEYMREALYMKLSENERKRAHSNAGSYFQKDADSAGNHAEGKIESLLQAINHYEKAENIDSLLKVVGPAYDCLLEQGDLEGALKIACSSVKASKQKNDRALTVHWLIQLIQCDPDRICTPESRARIEEAFKLLPRKTAEKKVQQEEEPKWMALEAQLWILKGQSEELNQDPEPREEYFSKGVDLASRSGDLRAFAWALSEVAECERHQSKYVEAKQHLSRASEIAEKIGDITRLENCMCQLGLIARRDNLDEAKLLFEQAYKKAQAADDVEGEQIQLSLIGDIALRKGNFKEAEQIFSERLSRERKINNPRAIRITLGWLVASKIGIGDLAQAESLLCEYEDKCKEAQDEIGIAWSLARRGTLEQARSNIEKGNELIQEGIDKLKKIGQKDYVKDMGALLRY